MVRRETDVWDYKRCLFAWLMVGWMYCLLFLFYLFSNFINHLFVKF